MPDSFPCPNCGALLGRKPYPAHQIVREPLECCPASGMVHFWVPPLMGQRIQGRLPETGRRYDVCWLPAPMDRRSNLSPSEVTRWELQVNQPGLVSSQTRVIGLVRWRPGQQGIEFCVAASAGSAANGRGREFQPMPIHPVTEAEVLKALEATLDWCWARELAAIPDPQWESDSEDDCHGSIFADGFWDRGVVGDSVDSATPEKDESEPELE